MPIGDWKIGDEFACGPGRYRVTDIGSRVIVAIRIDEVKVMTLDHQAEEAVAGTLNQTEAEKHGWFRGPPYAVKELVFVEVEQSVLTRLEPTA